MPNEKHPNTSSKSIRSLRITVLAGGPSSEREVSLVSGKAVTDALASLGHKVRMLDISPADLSALDLPADVIFPAMHGHFGEDGQVQQILDQRGIPYVGCGAEASAMAIDKVLTKQKAAQAGVMTPQWLLVTPDTRNSPMPAWAHARSVVKPVDQGSSVDIHIVPDMRPLAEATGRLVDKYGQALIEQFIDGPELTVGVLDGRALPVIQIIPNRERTFYDYQAKYHDDNTQYLVNPPMPASLLHRVQDLSLTVFEGLGCRDISRIDWRIDKTTGEAYFLEVNTLPGFTSHSLVPKAAAAVGIDFAHLCQMLAELALRRSPQSAAA